MTDRLTRRAVLGRLAATLGGAGAWPARPASSAVLQVGPTRAITTLAEAARRVRNGDTVEIDAGEYAGDVAVWARSGLTLRAVGGRVRLLARGAIAEDKAIWVVRGEGVSVQGVDFEGARAGGRNGAGIRFERGSLQVRQCRFFDNENGILTANDGAMRLAIEDSEFGFNGHGDGQSHNLYVGRIARLEVTGSYFHHARIGHLLKSRAATSLVAYNRLTDEDDGTASYELEFPDGGDALVIGNLVGQGPHTDNPSVVAYGMEGRPWPTDRLRLVHNTLFDRLPAGGALLRIGPGRAPELVAAENVLVGASHLEDAGAGRFRRNFTVDWNAFEDADRGDFRLKRSAPVARSVSADPDLPTPTREYVHPHSSRSLDGPVVQPGAFQSPGTPGR